MIHELNDHCYEHLRRGYWANLNEKHNEDPDIDGMGKTVEIIYRIDNIAYHPFMRIIRNSLRKRRT